MQLPPHPFFLSIHLLPFSILPWGFSLPLQPGELGHEAARWRQRSGVCAPRAVQLPRVLALCSAPLRSGAGNVVGACQWENMAYCPLQRLGLWQQEHPELCQQTVNEQDLGRNLNSSVQGIT